MKVFIFIGSLRGENSSTLKSARTLLNYLEQNSDCDVVSYVYHAQNVNIQDCTGCCNCFLKGKCPLDDTDDMKSIKKEIIDSDIFIIGSPVYFHHVSSTTKKIIDRLSYWGHLFKLTGKIGLSISTSSNNGNEYVDYYLEKLLIYLGAHPVNPLSLLVDLMSLDEIDYAVKEVGKEVIKHYKDLKDIAPPRMQENVFHTYRGLYSQLGNETYESKYWHKNELIKFDTFKRFRNYILEKN